MKIRKKNKQGISLIVLVITIIVMIILAAAVILSLSSNGIINRANQAVSDTDIKQVQTLAQTLWSEAYLEQREDASVDIDTYVRTKLAENKIDVDKYVVDITDKGVEVEAKAPLLEKWEESVWNITNDGVPIPKGYVASPYEGEETKSGGLVIYKLTPEEIEEGLTELPEESYETSLTTRNQYVWVPIAKEEFKTKFVRNYEHNNDKITNELGGGGYYELALNEDNMPLYEENAAFYDEAFANEAIYMYESVKEHEGFYIARYEGTFEITDMENEEVSLTSVMGKMPIASNDMTLSDIVETTRYMVQSENESEIYGAYRTPAYGVQWDATIRWFLDTKAIDVTKKAREYGYVELTEDGEIILKEQDFNAGAMFSSSIDEFGLSKGEEIQFDENGEISNENLLNAEELGAVPLFSSGALKRAKVNNVYDMIGNHTEVTLEKIDDKYTTRGWDTLTGSVLAGDYVSFRLSQEFIKRLNSCRESMYIK